MKIYVVTVRGYDTLGDKIVKLFSDKDLLNKWLEYADQMEKELNGGESYDPSTPISKRYRISEADMDNLDFIDLLNSSRQLGAQVKPSKPQ